MGIAIEIAPAAAVRDAALHTLEVCPAVQVEAKPRIQFIDATRGMLLVLMASSHALGLAGVPDQFLSSSWWIPIGWPTG